MKDRSDPSLDELKHRISKAKRKVDVADQPPPPNGSAAYRMSAELVAGTFVGAIMGYGFDELLGTVPLMTILLLLAGFAAGMRNVFRSAKAMQEAALEDVEGNKPCADDKANP